MPSLEDVFIARLAASVTRSADSSVLIVMTRRSLSVSLCRHFVIRAVADSLVARRRDRARASRTAIAWPRPARGKRARRRRRRRADLARKPIVGASAGYIAHQSRHRVLRFRSPTAPGWWSIPTFPTTSCRACRFSGRSTPPAASTRSSAPRSPRRRPPARTSRRPAPICVSRSFAPTGPR